MKRIEGLIAATYTPLNDSGELDLSKIGPYAEWLVKNDVKGVFINGSTGDFTSLSTAERKLVVEEWGKCRPDNFALMAHVGDTSADESREMAAHAAKHNMDAIAILSPYYFKPASVELLVELSKYVATAAPETPFYYYHIPVLTGGNFDMINFMEQVIETIPNFRGLKFTEQDLMSYKCCLEFQKGKYDILFGVDEILVSGLALGAKGGVGSTYNHLAPLYNEIIRCFHNNELEKAHKLQYKSMQFVQILAKHGFLSASKSLMGLLGLDLGPTRLPHKATGAAEMSQIKRELDEIGVLEWASKAGVMV